MNRKQKIATAAAIAATAIVAFGLGHQAANAEAAAKEAAQKRAAELIQSAKLCEQANGRWYTTANGSPRCDTHATVRTTLNCRQDAAKRTEAANIIVCDETK